MIYWIRFPNDKEHVKAVEAWLDITTARLGLPGGETVVSDEHIRALKRAKVKFECISKSLRNGKASSRRKS